MAYAVNNERLLYMITTGLAQLLRPFGGFIADVRIDRMYDTMEVRVWVRVEVNGETKAQSTKMDRWQLQDSPAETANTAIYALLKAFVPIEDIKEAVAEGCLPTDVLQDLEGESGCQ